MRKKRIIISKGGGGGGGTLQLQRGIMEMVNRNFKGRTNFSQLKNDGKWKNGPYT